MQMSSFVREMSMTFNFKVSKSICANCAVGSLIFSTPFAERFLTIKIGLWLQHGAQFLQN